MLILVIQPRVHPLARQTYAEVDAYFYAGGHAEKLGTYESEDLPGLVSSLMKQEEPQVLRAKLAHLSSYPHSQ